MDSTLDKAQAGNGRKIALLGGDVVTLMVFAAIGRSSHGEAAGLGAIAEVARTASPFLIGWLITSPMVGAFNLEATDRPLKMLRTTALSWCVAVVAGALLRALFIGRFSPFSFYVVTFIVALLLLGVWRGTFALWEARAR